MSKLDPRIEVIREKFGLDGADFWELPQKKGTWVAKHAALEVAAVKAGIVFDMPVVIEKDAASLVTSIIVQGSMDGRTEWSIGETNPSNYHVTGKQPSYPWAMSEKRAKDRVILKLIGIHGLVYSEDEMTDLDQHTPKSLARDPYKELQAEIDACLTLDDLKRLWASDVFQAELKRMKPDWQAQLEERKDELKATLSKAKPVVAPNFEKLQS